MESWVLMDGRSVGGCLLMRLARWSELGFGLIKILSTGVYVGLQGLREFEGRLSGLTGQSYRRTT